MTSHRLITILLVSLIAGSMLLSPVLGAQGDQWMTDLEEAKKKARETGKCLLVDFSGSDWCIWCIRLDKEVFNTDTFKTWSSEHLVLCLIDLPQNKEKIGIEKYEENNKIRKEYRIQGFPTVLLLKSDGTEYARTGYQAGGPEKYIRHLEELMVCRHWRKKLAIIDFLKDSEQIAFAAEHLELMSRELSDEERLKLSTIIFMKDVGDTTQKREESAVAVATAEGKNQDAAVDWLKTEAEKGNSNPYAEFLFLSSKEEYKNFADLVDKNKEAPVEGNTIKETGKKLLTDTLKMKEYAKSQDLKKDISLRLVLLYGVQGETDKSIELVDSIYRAEYRAVKKADGLKEYIQSLK